MAHRENYKEGVPSVKTDLLTWAGYFNDYSNDPTGYYLKKGSFCEQLGTIYLQGQTPDDLTIEAAYAIRKSPNGDREQWMAYVDGLRDWMSQHKIKFIAAQQYVYNPWCTYQGTLDWLLEVDGELTVVDCKTGTCPKVTALQIAGYDMALTNILDTFKSEVVDALKTWGLKKPRKRLGLQLEPSKCTPHPYDKFSRDNDVFRNLVSCWWMHNPASKEYR